MRSAKDLQYFFHRFVLDFVPGCSDEYLQARAKQFIGKSNTWGSDSISIDMVKQFLMQRISAFRAAQLSNGSVRPGTTFVVPKDMQSHFFDYLCEEEPAIKHLDCYPDVGDARDL